MNLIMNPTTCSMCTNKKCVSSLGLAVLTIFERKRLRKATPTRHIKVAENLLKSLGNRRKLRELAAKIEEALRELDRASEEYESFLELEALQEHLTLAENAVERANLCLESIQLSINERESELPSEAGSEYAPSLQFESASGHGTPSRASENERRARVMDLQVEQAKREP